MSAESRELFPKSATRSAPEIQDTINPAVRAGMIEGDLEAAREQIGDLQMALAESRTMVLHLQSKLESTSADLGNERERRKTAEVKCDVYWEIIDKRLILSKGDYR